MERFVSHYVMKLDAKGRLSVPAQFRAVLARDGFEGLYCIPTPDLSAIDAGGNALLETLESRLAQVDPHSEEHDLLSTAFYGQSEILKVDGEGRIVLPETLKDVAGITDRASLVGQGYRFQIWEPDRFAAHLSEARARTRDLLRASSGRSRREVLAAEGTGT